MGKSASQGVVMGMEVITGMLVKNVDSQPPRQYPKPIKLEFLIEGNFLKVLQVIPIGSHCCKSIGYGF